VPGPAVASLVPRLRRGGNGEVVGPDNRILACAALAAWFLPLQLPVAGDDGVPQTPRPAVPLRLSPAGYTQKEP